MAGNTVLFGMAGDNYPPDTDLQPGVERTTFWRQVQRPNGYAKSDAFLTGTPAIR